MSPPVASVTKPRPQDAFLLVSCALFPSPHDLGLTLPWTLLLVSHHLQVTWSSSLLLTVSLRLFTWFLSRNSHRPRNWGRSWSGRYFIFMGSRWTLSRIEGPNLYLVSGENSVTSWAYLSVSLQASALRWTDKARGITKRLKPNFTSCTKRTLLSGLLTCLE